ncbi:MAG: hypothetical protein HY785_16665 [Oscillatoriophycideae cyanobacterium NC_groundwater_1537_Pr4_S-0.65um_50_18]|nr:hypothetical protein [Oscillatoriophycideae cyanobacterium NC_groundwater_1537_Pr4_S-0.65um_50_18]
MPKSSEGKFAGFEWCGLKLDGDRNQKIIDREGCITTEDSHLHVYVIPVEEGLMIAQESIQCLKN